MQEIGFRVRSNDGSLSGTALEAWNSKVIDGAAKLGKDWDCTPNYKRWFEEAGFVDVVEKVFYWPGNAWVKGEKGKKIGSCMLANALQGLSAASLAIFTRVFGMSVEEVEESLEAVRRDLRDSSIHAYYPL